MPDGKGSASFRGRVFFDGDCACCRRLVSRRGKLFTRRGFVFEPLQAVVARSEFEIPAGEFLREMKLLSPGDRWFGGINAWIVLLKSVWWLWPFGLLASLPGFHKLADHAYRWVAANRHCLVGRASCLSPVRVSERAFTQPSASTNSGASTLRVSKMVDGRTLADVGDRCANGHSESSIAPAVAATGRMPVLPRWLAVAPLLVLPAIAFALKPLLDPWLFMWVLAVAIFAGCKWLSWADAARRGVRYSPTATLLYLCCWPGMNADRFTTPGERSPLRAGEWLAAIIKTSLGATLVWVAIPTMSEATWATGMSPLLIGWLGMIGIILMLHFGLFHLLSLALRRGGYHAPPMMNAPLLAGSVADFWGRRWNQPFHQLTTRYAFNPLRRKLGPGGALLGCFIVSGLLHDLVITVPAGAAYGWPTVYFVVQGTGLLLERWVFQGARRDRTSLRRAYTWLVVAAPVGLLFPPVFVERIILPMLHALGAH